MSRGGGNLVDLTGQIFGSWTVLKRVENTRSGNSRWLCRCDCGKEHSVMGADLHRARTTMCRTCAGVKHSRQRTHGMAHTAEHGRWNAMLNRCRNPNDRGYKNYGGRGITVCPAWYDFAQYHADLLAEIGPRPSPKHSLDRKDNGGNYEPGNVRWATRSEQRTNQRSGIKRPRSKKAVP